MIDTHCHLNLAPMDADPGLAVEEASRAGVAQIIVPGVSSATSKRSLELARAYPTVFAAVGIHPQASGEEGSGEIKRLLLEYSSHIVAVGEVGLDFFHTEEDSSAQQAVFCQMLDLAVEFSKPVIIHSRAAHRQTIEVLKKYQGLSIVIHSFCGTEEEAEEYVAAGYYLGLNGIITFKKNDQLRNDVKGISLEKIVLETDAPYLTPEGYRGSKNLPKHLPSVARCLAEVKELTVDVVDKITTETAQKIFNLPL